MPRIRGVSETGVPIGTIIHYPVNQIPFGFMIADGASISRTVYSQLFGVIRTSFGTGDGSTTFSIPNYFGRILRGSNVGVSGGLDPAAATRTPIDAGTFPLPNATSLDGTDIFTLTGGSDTTNLAVGKQVTNAGLLPSTTVTVIEILSLTSFRVDTITSPDFIDGTLDCSNNVLAPYPGTEQVDDILPHNHETEVTGLSGFAGSHAHSLSGSTMSLGGPFEAKQAGTAPWFAFPTSGTNGIGDHYHYAPTNAGSVQTYPLNVSIVPCIAYTH